MEPQTMNEPNKEICPFCQSTNVVKNGRVALKDSFTQNFLCRDCRKQHHKGNKRRELDSSTVTLIERMLSERISLRGIARVLKLSDKTVRNYAKKFYQIAAKKGVVATNIESDCQTNICEADMDEAWTYVGNKQNKQWKWAALDHKTGQEIAMVIGPRDSRSARKLLNSLDKEWQNYAFFYSDDFPAYAKVLPPDRHIVNDEEHQNVVENFFMRLRSRASRLVRKTVSYSKKLFNHIASIIIVVNELNLSYS